jgi:hypothetical protein
MKTTDFENKMKKHARKFDELWTKIVSDVNEGRKNELPIGNETEKLIDNLCLAGAWINDRLTGKSGIIHAKEYRGSLSKKVRKALGYTY